MISMDREEAIDGEVSRVLERVNVGGSKEPLKWKMFLRYDRHRSTTTESQTALWQSMHAFTLRERFGSSSNFRAHAIPYPESPSTPSPRELQRLA